jgi:hypothetical protein
VPWVSPGETLTLTLTQHAPRLGLPRDARALAAGVRSDAPVRALGEARLHVHEGTRLHVHVLCTPAVG